MSLFCFYSFINNQLVLNEGSFSALFIDRGIIFLADTDIA